MEGIIDVNTFEEEMDSLKYTVQKKDKKSNHNLRKGLHKNYNPPGYDNIDKVYPIWQLAFQVTEDCNLNCSYCYQLKKTPRALTLEEGKRFIDIVLGLVDDEDKKKYGKFILKSPFTFHLIGGEPFLKAELCYKLTKYFDDKIKENAIPIRWKIWIPTNGTIYDNEWVQKLISEYSDRLDLAFSIDGCKECHNQCRIYKNSNVGSYDAAKKNFDKYRAEYGDDRTKFTLSPYNIKYLRKSFIDMVDDGIANMFFNWELEDFYSPEICNQYYKDCKWIIDYILENDLEQKLDFSPLTRTHDSYISKTSIDNMCGGGGNSVVLIPGGGIYPCVRYAETSLDEGVPPLVVGTLEEGIATTETYKKNFESMVESRYSSSSYKCYNCPLSEMCMYCSANNYNMAKEMHHRSTVACNMQIVDQLVRAYGVNKIYRKYESYNHNYYYMTYHVLIPKEYAIPIIGEEEYNLIKYLSRENM